MQIKLSKSNRVRGQLYRKIRLDAGLTQKEVADKLEYRSHVSVSKMESGDRKVKSRDIHGILSLVHPSCGNNIPKL